MGWDTGRFEDYTVWGREDEKHNEMEREMTRGSEIRKSGGTQAKKN